MYADWAVLLKTLQFFVSTVYESAINCEPENLERTTFNVWLRGGDNQTDCSNIIDSIIFSLLADTNRVSCMLVSVRMLRLLQNTINDSIDRRRHARKLLHVVYWRLSRSVLYQRTRSRRHHMMYVVTTPSVPSFIPIGINSSVESKPDQPTGTVRVCVIGCRLYRRAAAQVLWLNDGEHMFRLLAELAICDSWCKVGWCPAIDPTKNLNWNLSTTLNCLGQYFRRMGPKLFLNIQLLRPTS